MTFVNVPSEAIRGRWTWFFGFGVVLAVVGLIALWNVVDATLVTTILVGWLLILGGIVQVAAAFAGAGSTGWRILSAIIGLLYAIVGFNIVADPLAGAIALTIVIAVVLIVEGVIRLYHAFSREMPQRGLTAVVGVIDILLGVWIGTNLPVSGVAIGFFVGLQLLMAGILWMVLGWMARSATEAPAPRPAA